MRKVAGVISLCVCMIATGCGGGSQTTSSQPSQSTSTTSVATGSHVVGDANAKVTIIEFGDFQCPFCKSFYTDTEWQIVSEYVNTGKARFAFREFPLGSIHVNAQVAAEAAECAAKVGGNDAFWKYHETLFTNGKGDGTGLDVASLKQYAVVMQLDTASFNACVDSHAAAAIVSKDVSDGGAAGVQGTPTFFINGKKFVGAMPFSSFKTAIDAEL